MGLDIRLPIGLMFALLGVMLVLYGLFTGDTLYDTHSLGINVNLWWGLVMTAFGGTFLYLSRRSLKRPTDTQSEA